MRNGGSITYFEVNDTVIGRSRASELKLPLSKRVFNGAIVITPDQKLEIQPVNSDEIYEQSKQEVAVLVSGPLLLFNSEQLELPDTDFANNRHPRTCLCETNESVLFITIDGRSINAEGMSLIEAQKFLMELRCIDAINSDGGGSTTVWIEGKGVVNLPRNV